jgi:hypothetical protein
VTYVLAAYTVAALLLILYEVKLWDEFSRESQKRQRPLRRHPTD